MKSSVTSRKQRFWALLLAVVMVVGLLPTAGAKAAGPYNMSDTVTPFTAGQYVDVGEIINNVNAAGSNDVEIQYWDYQDYTRYLKKENATPGTPYAILAYTGNILPAAAVSERWKVRLSDVYVPGGCGHSTRVFLEAVPKYTLNWNLGTGATVTFANDKALSLSYTPGDDAINLAPTNYKATRKGYTFTGWKVGVNSVGNDGDNVTSITYTTVTNLDGYDSAAATTVTYDYTINLVAQWQSDTYTVKYNANAPEGEALINPTPETVTYDSNINVGTNDSVTLPASPTDAAGAGPKHYDFNKWSVDITGTPTPPLHDTWDSVTVPTLLNEQYGTADYGTTIDIRANWIGKLYYIDYNLSAPGASPVPSGVAAPTQSPKKHYGTDSFDIETMNDTSNSFAFKGWSFDGKTMDPTKIDLYPGTDTVKNVVDSYENNWGPVVGSGNIEVYGVWIPKHAVTCHGNGDDANSNITNYVEDGDTYPLSKNTSDDNLYFVRTGYHMIGWNTKADGSGDPYALGATTGKIYGETHFYAQWAINNYNVTFDVQGIGTAPAGQTVAYNGTVTEPTVAPSATGYTFGGWYKEAACTNAWNFTTDKVTAATTLYAKWTAIPYAVTFDVQGKGTAPADQNVDYNTLATEPTPAPTETGYTFGGWYKEAACTNAWNFTNDKVTAAVTLYAKWTANNYTVTFDAQGHGTAPAAQSVVYNGVAAEPAALTATGYTFGGWYKEAACTNKWDFTNDKVTAAVTLYAKWTQNNNNNNNPNPNPPAPIIKYYTITWIDGDNNLIYTEQVAEGSTPVYNKAQHGTPTKNPTGYATYSFNNTWSPAITKVTGNQEYVAQFDVFGPEGGQENPTPTVTPKPTTTPTPAAPAEYDIEYYEELPDGTEVQLKKTNNPDKYTYGVGAEIKYGIDKEGYTFEGWYSKRSKKYVKKVGTKAKGTVKLYAIFVPDDSGKGNEGDNGKGLPTDFSTLFVRLIDYTENSMTLKWEKMEYVDGYDILGSRCNSKDVIRPYEPIVSVDADTDEYVMSDLLAKTYYKFYVRAFILVNGEKRYITTSINVHGVTLNDTYGVADELEIEKVVAKYINGKSKTKYVRSTAADDGEINITLKVGQSLKIVTSEYNRDGKEIRAHRPISFESSDPAICKIGKKSSHKYGVVVADKANTYKSHTITALAAGECDIYVFAQNGVYKTIHVTVK